MRRSPVGTTALLLAAAVVAAACGAASSPSSPSAWGSEAQAWMDGAEAAAEREGAIGMAPFFAPDAEMDGRSVYPSRRVLVGWDEIQLHYYGHLFAGPGDVWTDDPVLLDVDGAALVGIHVDPTPMEGLVTSTGMVLSLEIGPDGIRRQIGTFSTSTFRAVGLQVEQMEATEDLARTWARLWSTGTPPPAGTPAMDEIYHPSVRLRDTLRRIDLVGLDAVAARHDVADATGWSLATTGLGEPAVYHYARDRGRLDGVLLLADGHGGSAGADCPGRQAVWLTLDPDDGRVVEERRFWSVDDARRCGDPERLPRVWWTGRSLPESARAPFEDLTRVTDRFTVAGHEVEVRNGTPTLEALLQWGLARFDQAGMAPPRFDSVTFTSHADYCEDIRGRVIPVQVDEEVQGWEIRYCLDDDSICASPPCATFDTAARHTILHELAHVWTEEYLRDEVRDHYLDLIGLETWNDRSVPWDERGAEWAAETVVWGLIGEPAGVGRLDGATEEGFAAGFGLLTGVHPLRTGP